MSNDFLQRMIDCLDSIQDDWRNKQKMRAMMTLILCLESILLIGIDPVFTLALGISGIIGLFIGYDEDYGTLYNMCAVLLTACIFLSVKNISAIYF